jgi:hypothetical protein
MVDQLSIDLARRVGKGAVATSRRKIEVIVISRAGQSKPAGDDRRVHGAG